MSMKKTDIQYRNVSGGKIHIVKDNNFYYCGYPIFNGIDVPVDPDFWDGKKEDVCKNCLKVKNKQKKINSREETNNKKMNNGMTTLHNKRCPKCNCKLLTNGKKVWCFYQCEKTETPKKRKLVEINNGKDMRKFLRENDMFLCDLRNVIDLLIYTKDVHIDCMTIRQLKIINEAEESLLDLCVLSLNEMIDLVRRTK